MYKVVMINKKVKEIVIATIVAPAKDKQIHDTHSLR